MNEPIASTRYREIEGWLRGLVLAGQEGDILPSEADLSRQFSVSRMTARQAVQNLAAEDLVVRRRGSGTYIAPKPIHRHSGPLLSFSDDMRRRGLTASSTIISSGTRPASDDEIDTLRLDEAHARIVAISRLRLADGSPMAIEHATLTPDCAPVLAFDIETLSMHSVLQSLGRIPAVARSWITARPATEREATWLDIARRSPVLTERRIITDTEGRPLEYTTSIYNPQRYVIDAVFTLRPTVDDPTEANPRP